MYWNTVEIERPYIASLAACSLPKTQHCTVPQMYPTVTLRRIPFTIINNMTSSYQWSCFSYTEVPVSKKYIASSSEWEICSFILLCRYENLKEGTRTTTVWCMLRSTRWGLYHGPTVSWNPCIIHLLYSTMDPLYHGPIVSWTHCSSLDLMNITVLGRNNLLLVHLLTQPTTVQYLL